MMNGWHNNYPQYRPIYRDYGRQTYDGRRLYFAGERHYLYMGRYYNVCGRVLILGSWVFISCTPVYDAYDNDEPE